jgi:hypothetical protein
MRPFQRRTQRWTWARPFSVTERSDTGTRSAAQRRSSAKRSNLSTGMVHRSLSAQAREVALGLDRQAWRPSGCGSGGVAAARATVTGGGQCRTAPVRAQLRHVLTGPRRRGRLRVAPPHACPRRSESLHPLLLAATIPLACALRLQPPLGLWPLSERARRRLTGGSALRVGL